jgi:ABC-2 type transport system ATP-binding protein
MITARGLTRTFGPITAVDGIDLDLAKDRVVGVLGPNGAGKSTTMAMICGTLAPTVGEVHINGHSIQTAPARARASIGYLPETAPSDPEMVVHRWISFMASLWGLGGAPRRAAVERSMEACGVTQVATQRIGTLSRGYRQRVAMAACLVHDPSILILDEPTSGLDPAQVASLRALILTLAPGRLVLLCSHILSDVEAVCDDVIVLSGGRIVFEGPVPKGDPGQLESIYLDAVVGSAGGGS